MTVDVTGAAGLTQLGLLHEQRLLEKDRELVKLQQEIKLNQKQIMVCIFFCVQCFTQQGCV